MTKRYQTLDGFLFAPFNSSESHKNKDPEYDAKYRLYTEKNKIRIEGSCEIEDSFYIHMKVPSESHTNNYSYDVIIRFFSTDPVVIEQKHLRNYFIQFFSNSPSFMYQYAYLYNKEGFLIEALYDKLDPDYIDIPPEKTNGEMTLSYDKSIYLVCKFLSENKFKYLDKNIILKKKKPSNKFFSDISDFKSVKFDQCVMAEEKKLSKQLDKKKPNRKADKNKKQERNTTKKTAVKSTSQVSYVTIIPKKGGSPKIISGTKKTAKRSTRKI